MPSTVLLYRILRLGIGRTTRRIGPVAGSVLEAGKIGAGNGAGVGSANAEEDSKDVDDSVIPGLEHVTE